MFLLVDSMRDCLESGENNLELPEIVGKTVGFACSVKSVSMPRVGVTETSSKLSGNVPEEPLSSWRTVSFAG